MKTVRLSNGVEMPQLGYGVFKVAPEECERCVLDALRVGYRLIDTAQAYGNEEGVGSAISQCGISRNEIFLVSKIWISNFGYEKAKASIEESLRKLQTDYLDLMLVHQPFCDRYGAYRALEEAHRAGKIRAIGVSNFYPDHFIDIASNVEVVPHVNQVEMHVFNQQVMQQQIMEEFGTQIMSWAPLAQGRSELYANPLMTELSQRHGKSIAQVALRWLLQRGAVIIPKTTHVERMKENLNIFDFELSDEEMQAITSLDTHRSWFKDHHDPDIVRGFMAMR